MFKRSVASGGCPTKLSAPVWCQPSRRFGRCVLGSRRTNRRDGSGEKQPVLCRMRARPQRAPPATAKAIRIRVIDAFSAKFIQRRLATSKALFPLSPREIGVLSRATVTMIFITIIINVRATAYRAVMATVMKSSLLVCSPRTRDFAGFRHRTRQSRKKNRAAPSRLRRHGL